MIVYNVEPYGYNQDAIALWRSAGFDYQEGCWAEVDKNQSFPQVKVMIVRLQRKVTKELLQKFPHLKVLVSATTGIDHLQVDDIRERNIKLVTLRGKDRFLSSIPSTAEHTWALLLALIRYVPAANEHVKSGGWNRDCYRGYQLKNKNLGLIGLGRTGKKVAKYADAFELNVRYYDPHVSGTQYEKVESLEKLISVSDILSFHVHLNEETELLLNKDNIHYLQDNAILINTSRGKIWDEDAVVNRLFEKKLLGVAADVVATEMDDIHHSELIRAQQLDQNIIITPHIGGATWDAMWSCEYFIAQETIKLDAS